MVNAVMAALGIVLIAVMGIQPVQDVVLIRHAYVRTDRQNQGIGSRLLSELRRKTTRPILIGTWADASWAVRTQNMEVRMPSRTRF